MGIANLMQQHIPVLTAKRPCPDIQLRLENAFEQEVLTRDQWPTDRLRQRLLGLRTTHGWQLDAIEGAFQLGEQETIFKAVIAILQMPNMAPNRRFTLNVTPRASSPNAGMQR